MELASVSGIAPLLGLAPALLIALTFAWAIYRAGSRQVVVRRLWRLVFGTQEITDPQIKRFAEEEADLIAFRLLSGISVSSLEKARELIRWTQANGVQMYRLRLCGELFDADSRQVKTDRLPSPFVQGIRFSWLILWLLVAALSFGSLFVDRTVMTINATQRYFVATETEFGVPLSIFPFGPTSLKASDCVRATSVNAARSGFTEQEVGILCAVLNDAATSPHLKKSLHQQFWSSVKLFLLAAVLFWISFFGWAAGMAARKLADRRLDPSVSGTQLSLDLRS